MCLARRCRAGGAHFLQTAVDRRRQWPSRPFWVGPRGEKAQGGAVRAGYNPPSILAALMESRRALNALMRLRWGAESWS